MSNLEKLQAIELAVKVLGEIENLLIDDDIKEQLINHVLASIGIEIPQDKKYVPGSQDKILISLRKLGGSATRADIASDTGIDPNAVSSLLSKLSKKRIVEKIQLEQSSVRNGRGLEPEYIYKLVDNE